MVVSVHDIIKISSANELVFLTETPLWVNKAIENNLYVIVRRAPIKSNCIAIGIRGDGRHERMPGYISKSKINEVFTPEMITKRLDEITKPILMKETLEKVDIIMKQFNLEWGIFGSVAYEIVTGKSIITKKSDLDIVIRDGIPKYTLMRLGNKLDRLPIHVDVLIETSFGGYNLKEYLSEDSSKLLIKTNHGPSLISKKELII